MPRGSLSKVDMLSRLYELKNKLYRREYHYWSQDKYDAANQMLNEVLDILNEYAR